MFDRATSSRRETRLSRILLIAVAATSAAALSGSSDHQDSQHSRSASSKVTAVATERSLGNPADEGPHSGFLSVLDRLANHDDDSGLALADLQREVYRGAGFRGLDRLHEYELARLEAVSGGDPQVYEPVAWLQYRVARGFESRADHPLRAPAFSHAARLAGSMLEISRSTADQEFATDLLLCTAYTFLEEGRREDASDLFLRVTRFDAMNGPARLGLAAIHERYGRYDDVIRKLRPLVENGMGSDEATLRYAVNLARLEHHEAAESALTELVSHAAPGWVRAVGYQELARSMINRGDLSAAEALLRAAVKAHPENHTLTIQLALVLDLSSRTSDAVRLVESIQPDTDSARPSPRWQYALWPTFDRDERERALEERAEAAAEVLTRALADQGQWRS